jgi:hypothetical protein
MHCGDVETECHRKESIAMHAALRKISGRTGKELSEFIANTAVKSTDAFGQSSLEIVYEQTKTLMTLFNTEGPKKLGFDVDGELPAFMVVADLFGNRRGFHSKHPAIIRELCATFYGPVDCGFGNGSLIRHEIDVMTKQAKAIGCSLLLVLSAPWGTALGERFWRLCTVRKCADESKYIDSEYVFSSMQRPPAVQGSSVMGDSFSVVSCAASIAAMMKSWRAVDIDTDQNETHDPTPTTTDDTQDSKMISVMQDVIKNLKTRDKEQQALIKELESEREREVEKRVHERIEKERFVWATDTESLNRQIECQANEVAMERVKYDALKSEIRHLDSTLMPHVKSMYDEFQRSLSELCGKQLVLEEEIKSCNKKLSDARKRDTEFKRERTGFESTLDAKSAELTALRTEMRHLEGRSEQAKRTASDQITSLVDANQKASEKLAALQTALDGASATKHDALKKLETAESASRSEKNERRVDDIVANDAHDALVKARAFFKWATRTTKNAKPATQAEKPETDVDERGTTGGESPSDTGTKLVTQDLFNLVASSKGLIAHLNSFVEKVQAGGQPHTPERDSPVQPPPQPFFYTPPQYFGPPHAHYHSNYQQQPQYNNNQGFHPNHHHHHRRF